MRSEAFPVVQRQLVRRLNEARSGVAPLLFIAVALARVAGRLCGSGAHTCVGLCQGRFFLHDTLSDAGIWPALRAPSLVHGHRASPVLLAHAFCKPSV